jgi:hypothetical protein
MGTGNWLFPTLRAGVVSLLRPWEVLAPLQAAACWVFTIGDVLLGVRLPPDIPGQTSGYRLCLVLVHCSVRRQGSDVHSHVLIHAAAL